LLFTREIKLVSLYQDDARSNKRKIHIDLITAESPNTEVVQLDG